MEPMSKAKEPGPRKAILASGLTELQLAAKAGCSIGTVRKAKNFDLWPAQGRTRAGLKAALGVKP